MTFEVSSYHWLWFPTVWALNKQTKEKVEGREIAPFSLP
jgi:hypothetical protein